MLQWREPGIKTVYGVKLPLRGERNSRPLHPAERGSGAGQPDAKGGRRSAAVLWSNSAALPAGGYGARGRPPDIRVPGGRTAEGFE
ncbi:MAG: hypothetical protein R6V67_03095 [Spirochaetia bacterium]